MTKKQIDFQVQVAINNFLQNCNEMGFEVDDQMLAEYRQVLEGFAIREMADQQDDSELRVSQYDC